MCGVARDLLMAAATVLLADVVLATQQAPPEGDGDLFGPVFDVPLRRTTTGEAIVDVKLRLAVTPPEQHRGLMYRSSLNNNEGMLFLYKEPKQRVLWMKNTYIPLDAGWFTQDGTLREVHQLKPLDLTYRWSDRTDITMGLEVSDGFFEKHNITPGSAYLDKEALVSALGTRHIDAVPLVGSSSVTKVIAQPHIAGGDTLQEAPTQPTLRGGGMAIKEAALLDLAPQ